MPEWGTAGCPSPLPPPPPRPSALPPPTRAPSLLLPSCRRPPALDLHAAPAGLTPVGPSWPCWEQPGPGESAQGRQKKTLCVSVCSCVIRTSGWCILAELYLLIWFLKIMAQ